MKQINFFNFFEFRYSNFEFVYLDPISDLLIRIKNGYLAYKKSVSCPVSKIKVSILEILKKHKYIEDYKIDKKSRNIEVILRYEKKSPAMQEVVRVSKLGLRVYAGWKKLPNVLNGLGICIVSTSKGVMTGEEARKMKLGGEILCKVW